MQRALNLMTHSTVGMKALVALTGLIMFGFTIGHLAGNLLIFAGEEEMRAYAEFLHGNPEILWPARIILLLSVATHVALTVRLARRNQEARRNGYKHGKKDQLTSYAARTMILTGPLLLAFIVFHLVHLTVGVSMAPDTYSHVHLNPYVNAIYGFRVWWVAAIYIFANLLLGLHLVHGVWSALQSIGASHPQYKTLRNQVALGLTIFVAGGNVLIPTLALARVIGRDLPGVQAPEAAEDAEEGAAEAHASAD